MWEIVRWGLERENEETQYKTHCLQQYTHSACTYTHSTHTVHTHSTQHNTTLMYPLKYCVGGTMYPSHNNQFTTTLGNLWTYLLMNLFTCWSVVGDRGGLWTYLLMNLFTCWSVVGDRGGPFFPCSWWWSPPSGNMRSQNSLNSIPPLLLVSIPAHSVSTCSFLTFASPHFRIKASNSNLRMKSEQGRKNGREKGKGKGGKETKRERGGERERA